MTEDPMDAAWANVINTLCDIQDTEARTKILDALIEFNKVWCEEHKQRSV